MQKKMNELHIYQHEISKIKSLNHSNFAIYGPITCQGINLQTRPDILLSMCTQNILSCPASGIVLLIETFNEKYPF